MSFPQPGIIESSDRVNSAPRLVGWKDIATYLGKTERTVKRWGASRGLPVYRIPGGSKASVYAFPGEVNEWLTSSSTTDPERVESAAAPDAGETLPESAVTHASAPSPFLIEPASQFSVMPRLRTAAVITGLAGVGLALVIAAFSAAGASLPQRFRALFVKSQPNPASNSPAVSESDKMMARDYYLKGRYEWNQTPPNSLNRA